jgi:hypothetical protein
MRPVGPAPTFSLTESKKERETMSNVITIQPTRRELDRRSGNGIVVRLLWNSEPDTVSIELYDERSEELFDFEIPRERALDAFNHPFVYCAPRGFAPAEAEALEAEAA